MLTVETEVNGDSKSTYEKGPTLVGFLELVMLVQEILFSLDFSNRPSTSFFFSSPYSISPLRTPLSQQAVQAAVLSRLSLFFF
jgi:hypothetical protein